MKEKSASLTKIAGPSQNGTGSTANLSGGGTPKKHSFGKGTAAPSHPPKPKAPSLPAESTKPTEKEKVRNSSSGGKFYLTIRVVSS